MIWRFGFRAEVAYVRFPPNGLPAKCLLSQEQKDSVIETKSQQVNLEQSKHSHASAAALYTYLTLPGLRTFTGNI